MFKVRVRGVNQVMRSMAKADDEVFSATRKGIFEAAKYLMQKTIEKFGVYQSTGGEPKGYGAWKKLSYETRKRKLRKYGFADKPLIATGATKDSFSVQRGGKGTLAASVVSSSKALIHHVYGAPRAHVPMRDPIRVTAKEEKDACADIIERYIDDAIRRSGL